MCCSLTPELCDDPFGPDGDGISTSREYVAGNQLSLDMTCDKCGIEKKACTDTCHN